MHILLLHGGHIDQLKTAIAEDGHTVSTRRLDEGMGSQDSLLYIHDGPSWLKTEPIDAHDFDAILINYNMPDAPESHAIQLVDGITLKDNKKVVVLNKRDSILTAHNPSALYRHLNKFGFNTPLTIQASDMDGSTECLIHFSDLFGRGEYSVITDTDSIAGYLAPRTDLSRYHIQEYLRLKDPDIKLHSVLVSAGNAYDQCTMTSYPHAIWSSKIGNNFKAVNTPEHLAKLAEKVADSLTLSFCSVNLYDSKDRGPLVVSVNTETTQLVSFFEKEARIPAAKQLIQALEYNYVRSLD